MNITNAINLKTESKSLSKGSKGASHARYFLFIVALNKEQIDFFQYWLQWAKLAGFVKYLVSAMDAESEAIALSRNLNTFSPPDKLAYRHEFFLNRYQFFVHLSSQFYSRREIVVIARERDFFSYEEICHPMKMIQ